MQTQSPTQVTIEYIPAVATYRGYRVAVDRDSFDGTTVLVRLAPEPECGRLNLYCPSVRVNFAELVVRS